MADPKTETYATPARVRVALVDDHRVVRRGLRTYLESFGDLEVAGEASSGEEAQGAIEGWLPDVVVMDLLMPGGMDGVEAIRRVRALSPHTQVVALTSATDDARVVAALRAGAIGYVRKDADPEVLLAAIRAASRGQSLLDPAVAGVVLQELARGGPAGSDLTEREREVLRQLALGHTNREIADELCVSAETVKTHVGNILTKLHLAHRTQAAIYALKRGVVSLDEVGESEP
jgi:NarL family two-component system response regulator LiaR